MIGNKLEPFKFWCQKVLPNVYDDSLSYYEYLCKLNEYLNEVIEQINTLTDNMSDYESDLTAQWTTYSNDLTLQWTTYRNELSAQWQTYKTYIDNYFNNLDVQTEINNKLDQMALNGTLSALIEPFVGSDIQNTVNAWLTAHVDPVGSAVIVDNTLTITGAAADAKTTGDEINIIHSDIRNNIVNMLNSLSVLSNVNYVWEQGTFDGEGTLQPNAYRARNPLFISTSLFDSILLPNTDKYDFSIQQYDESKNFISAVGWVENSKYYIYTPNSNVKFIRVGAKLKSSFEITATELSELDAFDFGYINYDYNTKINAFKTEYNTYTATNDNNLYQIKKEKHYNVTWEQGSISNGADVDNQYRARIQGYIPVNKGDKLVFNVNNGTYAFAYSLIGVNYQFLEVVGWVTENTVYEVPENVAYLRVNAKKIPDVVFDETELSAISNYLYVVNTGYENTDIVYNRPKAIRSFDPLIGQDCTMVKGKLWIFYDSNINNKIYKLDLETEQATDTETQAFGHCNSVDYNPNNDSLLVYKTSTNNDPQAIIYKNPSAQSAMAITDANCALVNLYNNSTYLNPSASICWGENDNIIYMIDGIYDNLSNNHLTANISIRKLLLGMGTNDLSSEGYGTYTAVSSDKYNGTCKVLKTYNGVISNGINAIFDPSNLNGTAQGMEYDGDIYIAWGFSGHNFLRIKLNDADNTYHVVKNYMHNFTDNSGNIYYLEPEMLALNGDKIICGSIKSPNFKMLEFSR